MSRSHTRSDSLMPVIVRSQTSGVGLTNMRARTNTRWNLNGALRASSIDEFMSKLSHSKTPEQLHTSQTIDIVDLRCPRRNAILVNENSVDSNFPQSRILRCYTIVHNEFRNHNSLCPIGQAIKEPQPYVSANSANVQRSKTQPIIAPTPNHSATYIHKDDGRNSRSISNRFNSQQINDTADIREMQNCIPVKTAYRSLGPNGNATNGSRNPSSSRTTQATDNISDWPTTPNVGCVTQRDVTSYKSSPNQTQPETVTRRRAAGSRWRSSSNYPSELSSNRQFLQTPVFQNLNNPASTARNTQIEMKDKLKRSPLVPEAYGLSPKCIMKSSAEQANDIANQLRVLNMRNLRRETQRHLESRRGLEAAPKRQTRQSMSQGLDHNNLHRIATITPQAADVVVGNSTTTLPYAQNRGSVQSKPTTIEPACTDHITDITTEVNIPTRVPPESSLLTYRNNEAEEKSVSGIDAIDSRAEVVTINPNALTSYRVLPTLNSANTLHGTIRNASSSAVNSHRQPTVTRTRAGNSCYGMLDRLLHEMPTQSTPDCRHYSANHNQDRSYRRPPRLTENSANHGDSMNLRTEQCNQEGATDSSNRGNTTQRRSDLPTIISNRNSLSLCSRQMTTSPTTPHDTSLPTSQSRQLPESFPDPIHNRHRTTVDVMPNSHINGVVDEASNLSLPWSRFNDLRKNKLNVGSRSCTVCLEEFKHNDYQSWLPCVHTFHKRCIDKWLRKSATCPVCQLDVASLVRKTERCVIKR